MANLTDHARERMAERKIPEEDVDLAIRCGRRRRDRRDPWVLIITFDRIGLAAIVILAGCLLAPLDEDEDEPSWVKDALDGEASGQVRV